MTNEEAQKVIYEMICLGLLTPKENEALHIAYQAIKKQIPKKVLGDPYYEQCACPVCKQDIHGSYCSNCGQALDWGEGI